MKRLFLALCLGVCANAMAADVSTLAQGVRQRLIDAPVLRGEFEQSKRIAGFKKPVVSRGEFIVSRERGVLWNTREPFAGSLKMTRKEIVSTAGGNETMRMNTSDQPALQSIAGLLFSLFAGDISQLEKNFRIAGELRGTQGWQLLLEPRSEVLARTIARIELDGERFVRRVHIIEKVGDQTEIRLVNSSATPAQLSADESKRFD